MRTVAARTGSARRAGRPAACLLAVFLLVALLAGCVDPAVGNDPGPGPGGGESDGGGSDDGELEPLQLVLEVHVERVAQAGGYARQEAALRDLAEEAASVGVALTFEVDATFVADVASSGSDFFDLAISLGHALAVHDDAASVPATYDALLAHFAERLAELPVATSVVSGACNDGPWVEAAIDAGFTVATGMVDYCLRSLADEHLPSDWTREELDRCTPSTCHGRAIDNTETASHPWQTTRAESWTSDDGTGLWIMPGYGGVPCLAEDAAASPCRDAGTDADVATLAAAIDEYLVARTPGQVSVLALTWSIGPRPTDDFITAVLDLVGSYGDEVEAVTVEAAVAAAEEDR